MFEQLIRYDIVLMKKERKIEGKRKTETKLVTTDKG